MNPFLAHDLLVHVLGCKSCQMIGGNLTRVLELSAKECIAKSGAPPRVKGWLPAPSVVETGVHDDDTEGERAPGAR